MNTLKHKVNIRGVMVPNDYKPYYDYFGEDSTCPRDVQKVIDVMADDDELEVYINSPGGIIDVGSEIYTLLKGKKCSIYITGEACSAASIVAMAGYCEMSPTALMMVHCVSSCQQGNHSDMEHMAEVLSTADKALCSAYVEKAKMSEEEALKMMEHETWLTAKEAKARGLIDKIMFEDKNKEDIAFVAGPMFSLPTKEQMEKVNKMINDEPKSSKEDDGSFLIQQKLDFLKLKGELR